MRRLLKIICLLAIMAAPVQADEALYYHAAGQTLDFVLRDVAQGFGFEAYILPLSPVEIDGIFTPASPDLFFERMAQRYGFDWYLQGKKLFISPKTARKKLRFSFAAIPLREEFRHLLETNAPDAGTEFPLLDERGQDSVPTLMLEAPPSFLAHVEQIYHRYQTGHAIAAPGGEEEGVMIFHLNHAWAEDKTHRFANGSWTVPGIATLLTRLVGQPAALSSTSPAPDAVAPLTPMHEASANTTDQDSSASPPAKAASGLPIILPDPRINAVLIRDRRDKQAYYQKLIARLDRAAKLIQIEAMIVDIAKNRISDLGINWQASSGRDSFGFGAPPGGGASGDVNIALGQGAGGRSLIDDVSSLLARIRVLASRGESRIVSRPSILTMDNLEAVINTSERFYVKVEGYQDSSLVPVESGTTLRVTPHLIPSANISEIDKRPIPRIRLLVSIEDGSLDDSESARVDGLPRVQQHHVQTQAVVKHKSSLLIGGHVHSITSNSRSYVPLLGQLPILGWAFSNETMTKREFVRLFIIRPIVHDDAPLAELDHE